MNAATQKYINLFEGFNIHSHFDENKGKWFFSIIDIIAEEKPLQKE